MGISVFNSRELQGTILLLKGADRAIAKEIRQQSKAVIAPMWKEAVLAETRTALQVKVLGDTARVAVSDQNVVLSAGTVGRALRGGGTAKTLAAGTEFGSSAFRQFGTRVRGGKVVYPAAAQVIPRIAALFVQTTIRTFYEIIERKTRG